MDCNICFETYNESDRQPYTLSPCGHCFCLQCINKFERQQCPVDRNIFSSKIINRGILDILVSASSPETPNNFRDALKSNLRAKLKQSECLFEKLHAGIKEEKVKKLQLIENDTEQLKKELKLAKISIARHFDDITAWLDEPDSTNDKKKSMEHLVKARDHLNAIDLNFKFVAADSAIVLRGKNQIGSLITSENKNSDAAECINNISLHNASPVKIQKPETVILALYKYILC